MATSGKPSACTRVFTNVTKIFIRFLETRLIRVEKPYFLIRRAKEPFLAAMLLLNTKRRLAMIRATLEQVDNMYRNNTRFRKTIFEFDDVPVVEGESAYSDKGYLRVREKNYRFELLVDTDFLDDRYDYA